MKFEVDDEGEHPSYYDSKNFEQEQNFACDHVVVFHLFENVEMLNGPHMMKIDELIVLLNHHPLNCCNDDFANRKKNCYCCDADNQGVVDKELGFSFLHDFEVVVVADRNLNDDDYHFSTFDPQYDGMKRLMKKNLSFANLWMNHHD